MAGIFHPGSGRPGMRIKRRLRLENRETGAAIPRLEAVADLKLLDDTEFCEGGTVPLLMRA